MKRRQFPSSLALAALPAPPSWAGVAGLSPAASKPDQMITPHIAGTETTPRITLVSCGGAAQALCRGMRPAEVGLHRHLALDSSPRTLRTSHPASLTCLVSDGDGKPKTPAAARQATHQLANDIGSVMRGSDLLIIAAGLGGIAGTGVALGVQDIAAELGIPTLQIATQPFAFEDAARQQTAEQALAELQATGRHLLKIDLKTLSTAKGPETRLEDALAMAREAFAQALAHTAGRWQQDSRIAIDFADFQQLLGPTNESRTGSIGWGQASGPNRAEQAAWLALNHPLLRQTLRNPDQLAGLSVTLQSANNSLRPTEVRAVLQMIEARCGKKTDVLLDTALGVGEGLQVRLWAIRMMA
jgi:cell division protein FtsZ